jgi:thiol-disulfide isomerase/thioredoxin
MRFSFLPILILILCVSGMTGKTWFSPGLNHMPDGSVLASAKEVQSSSHHKSANRIPVKQIDAQGLKQLLAIGHERERPILVNFWATWCVPCVEEFPDLIRISEKYGASKLDFMTVSLDDASDINTKVPKFLARVGAKMPSYLLNAIEPEEAIRYMSKTWQGDLPATFLIDRRGQIAFEGFGRIKPDQLSAAIEPLIKK